MNSWMLLCNSGYAPGDYLIAVCACQLVKGFIDGGLGVWQPPSSELFDQVRACDVTMTVFAVTAIAKRPSFGM